jgi:hypothetical protein
MQLELTTDESETLRGMLHAYLPALRREVARTEERTLRHELVERQELCERLLARLDATFT